MSAGADFGGGLKVLLVDDEEDVREVLSVLLDQAGFLVESAGTMEAARKKGLATAFDIVITDKNLPDGNGLDLAAELKQIRPECEIVIITAYASLDSAVEAMRLDVADYLSKPFENLETVIARVRRVVETLALKRKNNSLVQELTDKNKMLEDMVIRDSLTRLYNHAYLQEYIEREVLRSRRYGLSFGLILLDVDDFKKVNDNLGHPVGDKVVQAFADVISNETRRTDVAIRLRGEEIAARYGGDEFAVVLPETDKKGTAAKAERLRATIESFEWGNRRLPTVTCSIGMASYPSDAGDRPSLIAAADSALYAAKQGGKNRMIGYSHAMASAGAQHTREMEQESAWRAALDRSIAARDFEYAYQPIVGAKDHSIFGYEGLCRPKDATFTNPGELFHAAERAGRINELGRVLREICVEPIDDLPEPAFLFVNLHPLEITQELADETATGLAKHARRIVLEITETAALKDFEHLRKLRTKLREQGFRIAVDDLGSGYSGLNSLALLEPEFVKLDMAMLRNIESKSRSARLIRHILEYANGEGIRVVAEGIETVEERDVVTDLGCHFLQGFFFARPQKPFVTKLEK
jgi:diguanylate cyclase (GGDEF)-like protein